MFFGIPRSLALGGLLLAAAAGAATLPYQGLATQASGMPKADGSYPAVFKLYSAAGTELWSESQTVSTKRGLFSVILGANTSIPASLFNGSPLFLGVSLDGGAESTPRLQLGSVPFSIGADSARVSQLADSAKSVAGLKTVRDSVQLLATMNASLTNTVSSQAAMIATQSQLMSIFLDVLAPNVTGIPWQSGISYGLLKDSRDGQLYRTVKIGSQAWMAQNLNFAKSTGSTGADTGVCYGGNAENCATYGRLYTWAEVMKGATSSSASPSGVRGICPSGWHVPSDAEWDTLMTAVGGSGSAGAKLKSVAGWYNAGNGADNYGFRALPGGFRHSGGSLYYVGYDGRWWSAAENGAQYAWYRNMYYDIANVVRFSYDKAGGFSLRCAQDVP